MDKKAWREQMLEVRDKIDKSQKQTKENKIREKLERLEIYQQAYTVLYYVSFKSEVDTHKLIKEALKENKVVAAPLVNKKSLLVKQISSFRQLKPGAMGILEPDKKRSSVKLKDLNVIIVPGVAFDKEHHRLGYGGGYYDRLLSKKEDFISISLAFEEQIIDKLPYNKYDQKVDFIVTDKRVL
ncbi:MAG: 5-formyltetrahydrofolate cyclo-ligase [Actinobacteria bacterium]|nr:MAG: 5-formyltetrahydrofolate cyclo-ligase [Actinomycetota bacterium]